MKKIVQSPKLDNNDDNMFNKTFCKFIEIITMNELPLCQMIKGSSVVLGSF